jgi:hypothetical protein
MLSALYHGATTPQIQAAHQIAVSMDSHLFNRVNQAIRPSDAHVCGALDFYPYASCQIFPQVFGVAELAHRFDAAWQYLGHALPSTN